MFYDQLIKLCEEHNEKPTPLLKSLGLSATNLKRWQNGSTVNSDILVKLSKHFGVPIDFFFEDDVNKQNKHTNLLNSAIFEQQGKIGEKIKKIRIKNSLTQKQLGILVGFPESNADIRIAQYESGIRVPKAELTEKIAEVLNVTTAELVVPELLCLLEKLGFKLAMFDDEPIIRANSDNLQLRGIMLEYMDKK
ncbi:MAG: helix-turn-helix transcriptional regulator [Oscillospiraceae bacterium]|nr:helix-turn-helix transcriptional regulator [Oscillospiraceae bacterium]